MATQTQPLSDTELAAARAAQDVLNAWHAKIIAQYSDWNDPPPGLHRVDKPTGWTWGPTKFRHP